MENQENLEKWNLDEINEEYAMESNAFDYESIKMLPNFGIKKYADSVYRGELVDNNQRSGYGVMTYRKNRVYEGNWFNDQRDQKGYERYSNGNTYEGDF